MHKVTSAYPFIFSFSFSLSFFLCFLFFLTLYLCFFFFAFTLPAVIKLLHFVKFTALKERLIMWIRLWIQISNRKFTHRIEHRWPMQATLYSHSTVSNRMKWRKTFSTSIRSRNKAKRSRLFFIIRIFFHQFWGNDFFQTNNRLIFISSIQLFLQYRINQLRITLDFLNFSTF